MTCLLLRLLSGTGMKLHSSMLGTFFVYTLALSMPIFEKKSSRIFLREISKLCIDRPGQPNLDFLKNRNIKSHNFITCPRSGLHIFLQNSVFSWYVNSIMTCNIQILTRNFFSEGAVHNFTKKLIVGDNYYTFFILFKAILPLVTRFFLCSLVRN